MKILSLIASIALLTSAYGAEPVTRAAFDLGSGRMKLLVAQVDPETDTILKVEHSNSRKVLLGYDFKRSADGSLSPEILAQLRQAISDLRAEAVEHGATEFSGIATAVFREASNGREVIEQLVVDHGINLQVISQEEEGQVGFMTAVAGSGLPRNRVISWDSGSASFQIVGGGGEHVLEGPLGTAKVMATMVEEVQERSFKGTNTANPTTMEDVVAMIDLVKERIPESPSWLAAQIAEGSQVVGIGQDWSLFGLVHAITGQQEISRESVWVAIELTVGRSDDEIAAYGVDPEAVLPKLALMYGVMEKFEIDQVTYAQSNGGTPAVLISPQYWQ